jgi:hypothetical protein
MAGKDTRKDSAWPARKDMAGKDTARTCGFPPFPTLIPLTMDHPMRPPLLLLTPEQIHTYLRDGILVVNNLLSATEIIEAQIGLASTLKQEYGVDVHDLEATGHKLVDASSTNGAGTCSCTCFCVFATCIV